MERIRKGSDLPKKSGGHRASNKNIRRSSYSKVHQFYILSFDSVRALEIHDVARATSCIPCALEMRSSNGRERPSEQLRACFLAKSKINTTEQPTTILACGRDRELWPGPTGSPRFTDFPSKLANLIGWEYETNTLRILTKSGRARALISATGQKDRGLWGREWPLRSYSRYLRAWFFAYWNLTPVV